jgi:hypothetical protein
MLAGFLTRDRDGFHGDRTQCDKLRLGRDSTFLLLAKYSTALAIVL